MIVRLTKANDPNVLGSINTGGTVPEASGVGEPLLEAWMLAHKGDSTEDATRALETFFASWNGKKGYSQVDRDAVKVPDEESTSAS